MPTVTGSFDLSSDYAPKSLLSLKKKAPPLSFLLGQTTPKSTTQASTATSVGDLGKNIDEIVSSLSGGTGYGVTYNPEEEASRKYGKILSNSFDSGVRMSKITKLSITPGKTGILLGA